MIPTQPAKPFPTYKWRWASYQPTEGLLNTDVYLGALRAFNQFEGERPSSPELVEALRIVQEQTKTNVDLVRDATRNLIRNAGQYWKGPGLLENTRGRIELTEFGKQVAEGRVTDSEFALTVVKTLALPNPRIDTPADLAQWKAVDLEIKPLELIIEVVSQLEKVAGNGEAYLTAHELIRVVIPLAGVKTPVVDHADALLAYRAGSLDISAWPDCAPRDNDGRMAHEFLLFLWHHGLFRAEENPEATRYQVKFFLISLEANDVIQLGEIIVPSSDTLAALRDVRKSQLPATVEEGRRVLTTVLARPQQAGFRRQVLKAYDLTCLLTGERMPEVLEAAHIIPKKNKGADTENNGFCLRSDVHKLFDAGHIRIEPTGKLHYSDAMVSSVTYNALPSSVNLPAFVTLSAVEWRWRYS